jgi:alpha-glucosidase (family GH31 glycosyl hydrolase)
MARFVRDGDGNITIDTTPSIAVEVCAGNIVRFRVEGKAERPEASYLQGKTWPAVSRPVAWDASSLATGNLALRLRGEPQHLELCDAHAAAWLRVELPAGGDEPKNRVRLHLVGEQHFYGMGQGGSFDRLATGRRLWNCHVNHANGSDIAIPLLVSTAGYGLFFDNSSLARLEAGDSDSTTWLDYAWHGSALDVYFLAGEGMRAALEAAAELLGRAPMPPRWSLGYLQSTRHFESADELSRLPATFRDKRLPCDALFLLSSYGEAKGWNQGVGSLDWDRKLVPDSEGFLAGLRAQQFHAITHEYPVLRRESPLYAEAQARRYLLDFAYPDTRDEDRTPTTYMTGQRFIDFSRPEACAWWWAQHRDLVRAGIDGWWLDGGEGPPAETQLSAGTGATLHNRYDLLRYRAFADGEAQDRGDSRTFLLCRSGGAGMQRFGAGTWTGDIDNTFATLEAQIALGLNVGMSGVPYWGTDIGGYYPTTAASGELFARWFQFGAFCPIFRAHGRVWRERLPWAYGDEIEAICRRYLELRYRLMPYTYTLAWHAHRSGIPLMRPLVLNHVDDPQTWQLQNEYLWGDDLLVAPVTREGATHWPVYLPEGRWHDFWTHEAYDGPRGLTVESPLDRLPLFVRAGSIVPMGPVVQHLSGPSAHDVTLLTYPAATASFTLYDDDGATNAYRLGESALTDFECASGPSALECRIGAPRGAANAVPAERTYTFQIRAESAPRRAKLRGGHSLPHGPDAGPHAWWHDGAFLFARLGRGPVEVVFDW